jgi:hypothetical protein
MFRVAPPLELKKLEAIFRHKVFKMLLKKEKITREMIAMLSSWVSCWSVSWSWGQIFNLDNSLCWL